MSAAAEHKPSRTFHKLQAHLRGRVGKAIEDFGMIVEGDQAAAMQAFMSGEVKVEGDMSALMGLMSTMAGGPLSPEDQQTVMAIFRKKIEEMTLPD